MAARMFRDGLGERRHVTNPAGNDTVEVLCLRGELTAVPSFEFALRERVSHLAQFRHAYYARVRSVERLNDAAATLALVSDQTEGIRLSDILEAADREPLPLDINAALCLIRQIVPAVAMLHDAAPQVSHGALAPERIIVTPHARVVLCDYVLGAALEQLRYSQERYWKELRVPTARVAGLPRFDHRTDVTAVGIIALSLIVGRPLRDEEFPARLPEVLGSAWAISARGGFEPLPAGLRAWLGRALQLDARSSFTTIAEAQTELDRVLGDSDFLAAPAALEAVLDAYRSIVAPAAPPPVEIPPAIRLPQAVNANVVAPPPVPSPSAVTSPVAAVSALEMAARPAPAMSPTPQLTVLADSVALPRTPAPPAPPKPPAPPAVPAKPAPRDVVIVSPKSPEPVIEEPDEVEDAPPAAARNWKAMAAAATIVVAVLGGGALAARSYVGRAARTDGTVVVNTNPPGAQLLIDGVLRGTTPATVAVAPGNHTLVIRTEGSDPRTIPISVAAGAQLSQYLDLPKTTPATGQLQVRTEPAGAQVLIDGVAKGPSPVTISDLMPGDHTVAVEGELGKVEQSVSVTAGALASVVVPLGAPRGAPVSGWISVAAPADVQLYENGKLLGSSQMDRLMVSAGQHQLELVNESLGYRATKTVQVSPGKVSPIRIDFPKGTVALNAIPWADVWIDGEKVGETPLGNVQVPIGSHEVIFRNPDLGEQRHTVVVSLTAPARLSVDLRKK